MEKTISLTVGQAVAVITAILALGGIIAEFRHVQSELDKHSDYAQQELMTLERRLDKKIELINELEDRIRNLEACQ